MFSGDVGDAPLVAREHAAFSIDPDGQVVFPIGGQQNRVDYIKRADPRLIGPNDEWKFANDQHPNAQWQPGSHGKGFLMNDGSMHSWNLTPNPEMQSPDSDGSPSHYEYFVNNFTDKKLEDLNDYWGFNEVNNQYEDQVDAAFLISPNGTVQYPDEAPHTRLERGLAEAHPDARLDYRDWQFSASAQLPILHESVPASDYHTKTAGDASAFATELQLWLQEVDENNRAKTAPTPHHDDPNDLIQQPGFVSRIKRALTPKKKQFTPKPELTPEEEYEEQKEEWAENDNGWGWPTRYPYQEQPWRTK
jgi:hypothetical protein